MRPSQTVRVSPASALLSLQPLLDRISLQRLLTGLAVLAAALYVIGFLVAGALRVFFAYPLEVQEDASLQVLRQIQQGHPIYGPASLTYVPVIYPPLYFYVSAGVALITGGGFLPLRLVSLVASLGSAALIHGLVARETGGRVLGLVSAGLFVGCTVLALGILDLARVDALSVSLMLAAMFALRTADFRPRLGGQMSALAGVLAGLAILTKQTDALLAIGLLAYAAVWARRRLAPYALGLVITVGFGLLAVYSQADEWTRVYLLDLPRVHMLDDKHLANFWSDDVLPRFTLPLVLGPLFLVGRTLRRDWRTVGFYGLATVTLLSIAWGGWANRGAALNVLEPAFAMLSIMFGLGVGEGLSLVRGGGTELRALRNYLLAACVAQFLIIGYNPRSTVPLRSDGWAGDRLAQAISALPGDVFAPGYGEWSLRAGKGEQPAYGSVMELGGAFGTAPEVYGGAWQSDLAVALRARRYDYVLLDPTSDAFFLKGAVDQNGYVEIGPLFKPGDEFYLWRGGVTPDARVYAPAERANGLITH